MNDTKWLKSLLFFVMSAGLAMSGNFSIAYAHERPVMVFSDEKTFRQSFDTTRAHPGNRDRELFAALIVYKTLEERGIANDQIKVALVVHDEATYGFLTAEAYERRHGVGENPNAAVLQEILAKGGEVSASQMANDYYDIPEDDLLPGIRIAPNGFIAHTELQQRGYSLHPYGFKSKVAPEFTALGGGLPLSSARPTSMARSVNCMCAWQAHRDRSPI